MESSLEFFLFFNAIQVQISVEFFSLTSPKEKTDEASSSLFINQGSFLEGREEEKYFFPT